MKFVHLAPQPKIGNIKRNGIRCGDGRRGRGVYAVPLMMLQRASLTEDYKIIPSIPRSSGTLWKWLASERSNHRNLAAISFETTTEYWPADLYVDVAPSTGLEWIDFINPADIKIPDEDLQFVRQAHEQGFFASLAISVLRQPVIGAVLRHLQDAGFHTWNQYDESIELVFRKPVKAALIERIDPLYRTNKLFKRDHKQ